MNKLMAFAQWMVQEWAGRIDGRSTGLGLNFDRRFGNQCMDLWNWIWTFLGVPSQSVKRTYDAAGVWELPDDDPIWRYFRRVHPHETLQPGDTFVYNRNAFGAQGRGAGRGYGHIGMVIRDNGNGTIEVLEANGLGDGYEDEYLNQYGSPVRIHTWSKADLYGALRPIPEMCPGLDKFAGIQVVGAITTSEEDFMAGLIDAQQAEDIARRAAELVFEKLDNRIRINAIQAESIVQAATARTVAGVEARANGKIINRQQADDIAQAAARYTKEAAE